MSDELIARLRAAADDVSKATPALSALAHGIKLVDWSPDIREAADRIERMAAVVAAARKVYDRRWRHLSQCGEPWCDEMRVLDVEVESALAALDAQITDTTREDKVRCPNCSEKDANIAELIETLQRTEAAKEKK